MPALRYVVRLSVPTLIPSPIAGLDESEPEFEVGNTRVTVKRRGEFMVLQAGGFASEVDAASFLHKLKGGLWNLALEHDVAFTPSFHAQSVARPEDPHEAAINLQRAFGMAGQGPAQPVHGISQEEGFTIFREDENVLFFASGRPSVEIRTGWIQAQGSLMAGIERVRSPENIDPRLNTALDLYLSSYYETSLRARFLTLMTVLEVLAPIIEKHVTAVRLIAKLHKAIKVRLACKVDEEERDALEALQRELDFRKETSIRRRIRRLVLDRAPLDDVDRRTLANNVRDAYDLRGSVVHGNPINPEDLSNANEITLRAVKLLLRSSLGFAVAPVRSGGDCSE